MPPRRRLDHRQRDQRGRRRGDLRVATLARARAILRDYRATEIAPEPGMIPAAVAVILRDGAHGGGLEVLFIHRAVRAGDTWSGQIAFPGGRRDPTDADLRETAIRETREEVDLDLSAAELLGALDDLHPRTPVLPPVVVRPFVFGVGDVPPLTLSAEVQAAFWLPLARLREPGVRQEITMRHPGVGARVLPAYVIGGRTIWGMSERILTPFANVLE